LSTYRKVNQAGRLRRAGRGLAETTEQKLSKARKAMFKKKDLNGRY